MGQAIVYLWNIRVPFTPVVGSPCLLYTRYGPVAKIHYSKNLGMTLAINIIVLRFSQLSDKKLWSSVIALLECPFQR